MKSFIPLRVYYEEVVKEYEQGKELLERYKKMDIPLIPIEAHHKIEELRCRPNKEFTKMKKYQGNKAKKGFLGAVLEK